MSFDYYQILQLQPTATNAEIKAAYRRMAKLFHPDKNPGAEEKFKIIKEAYETLIDSTKRSRYDLKRNYNIAVQTPRTEPAKKQKTYSFDEAELKRRQYYQTHYKTKTTSYASQPVESVKTNYKELTYILISIPAAVALLLILVNLYQLPKHTKTDTTKIQVASEALTSESPYASSFGKNKYDTTSKAYIKVVNPSVNDAVVFLQNDSNKIIRNYFIERNYQLYIEHIPAGNYKLYYYAGTGFIKGKYLFSDIRGKFNQATAVDSFAETIKVEPSHKDSIILTIPKTYPQKVDTLLLRRIFKIN